jgi:hypothetical protein
MGVFRRMVEVGAGAFLTWRHFAGINSPVPETVCFISAGFSLRADERQVYDGPVALLNRFFR